MIVFVCSYVIEFLHVCLQVYECVNLCIACIFVFVCVCSSACMYAFCPETKYCALSAGQTIFYDWWKNMPLYVAVKMLIILTRLCINPWMTGFSFYINWLAGRDSKEKFNIQELGCCAWIRVSFLFFIFLTLVTLNFQQ